MLETSQRHLYQSGFNQKILIFIDCFIHWFIHVYMYVFQRIGLHKCQGWLGKSEVCRVGHQKEIGWNSHGLTLLSTHIISSFTGNPSSALSFQLIESGPPRLSRMIILRSIDYRLESHLQDTFTVMPRIVFGWVMEDCSQPILTHKTDHHSN